MKKLLLIITIILLASQSYALEIKKESQEFPVDKIREQNKNVIKMVVEEISKTLPQRVDKYTQMTKLRDENLTLIYTFEINSGAKSDEEVIKEGKDKMEKRVTKGVCNSSKRFIDSGISLVYEYISATTKKILFSFKMNEKICKELR